MPASRARRRDAAIRRAALTIAAAAAAAAITLFALHLTGHLPLGRIGMALWCPWLLAASSTSFRIAYLRVPAAQLADDWADRYAFGDAASLPLGDPSLDPLLNTAAARNVFSRPAAWSLFGAAGGLCWGGAVALTAAAGTGHVHPVPMDLLLGLLLLFTGAAHFTAAAVAAPSIYGQRAIRQAGALAHQRMRAAAPPQDHGGGNGSGLHLVDPRAPDAPSRRAAQ